MHKKLYNTLEELMKKDTAMLRYISTQIAVESMHFLEYGNHKGKIGTDLITTIQQGMRNMSERTNELPEGATYLPDGVNITNIAIENINNKVVKIIVRYHTPEDYILNNIPENEGVTLLDLVGNKEIEVRTSDNTPFSLDERKLLKHLNDKLTDMVRDFKILETFVASQKSLDISKKSVEVSEESLQVSAAALMFGVLVGVFGTLLALNQAGIIGG